MTKARKGVYAATITPLDAQGVPDLPRLAAYSKRLIAEGLTGVAPAGSTGEGNSMPMASRLEMPSHFKSAGIEPKRVIFGTGACAADDAVRLTRAALEADYPNVLVLPPFYYKNAPEDGLYAYYARLVESIGDRALRIYLYHFPQMSMTPIPISLVERLKRDFGPVIAGLKDSSGDFDGSLSFARAVEDFDVFPSNEAFLCRALAEGCAGIISATVNADPSRVARAMNFQSETEQKEIAELRALISDFPLSAALKQIEAWKSVDTSWCNLLPPLVALETEDCEKLKRALATCNLFPV